MKLNKKELSTAQKLIDYWIQNNFITNEDAEKLKNSYELKTTNWRLLAYYSFIIGVSCIVLSVIVLLADEPIRLFLEKLFNLSESGLSIIFFILSILVFLFANRRIKSHANQLLLNKSILIVASFFAIVAISFLGKALSLDEQNLHYLFLFSFIIYVCISIYYQYTFFWIIGLLFSTLFYLFLSHQFENKATYFLGMNLACRMIPLALIYIAFNKILKNNFLLNRFQYEHQLFSWIFLFFSIWLVSIFGNTTQLNRWFDTKQIYLLPYALFSIIFCIVIMYIAWKNSKIWLSNIAVTFLMINLLTRYVEYLWKPLHKSIFFIILAIIFIIIGKKSEHLWNTQYK